MNSQQYEELCRYFLAQKLGIDAQKIESVHISNPRRPDLPEYKHQIDLYWEINTELSSYLHIANAKWRGSDKVDQPEVLLLQKVKEKVAAHKALMLTTNGYTAGAIAAAKDEGIALHIVKPNMQITQLPTRGRCVIQAKIQEISASSNQPIFLHEVVHKAFDFSEVSAQAKQPSVPSRTPKYERRVVTGYETRLGGGHSHGAVTQSGG
jgi:hypothetical protein